MEKNYQNILLYYLKQLPKYNFIEEVVTPLQFIGNYGVTIQMKSLIQDMIYGILLYLF